MTTPTSPWNIPLFSVGDTLPSLEAVLNSQSNALNTALNSIAATSFGIPFATYSLLSAAPGTVVGQHASVNADGTAANNGDYVWSGSTWIKGAPYATAAGFATVAATGVTTITFPTGRFAVAPEVFAYGLVAASVSVAYTSAASTTTSFGVRLFTLGGAQIGGSVYWFAVQQALGSAAG